MKALTHTPIADSSPGVAFAECIIIFPFMLILLTGMVDLGRALDAYFTANKVAYEAVRYGVTIPGLTAGAYGPSPVASAPAAQDGIARRIAPLLQRERIPVDEVMLTTNFQRLPGNSEDRTLVVTVETPFVPLLGFFPVLRVTATAEGAYLLP